MLEKQCPLCASKVRNLVEVFQSSEIVTLYKTIHGLDVSEDFVGAPVIRLYRCPVCDLSFFSPPVAGSAAFYEALQQFPWYYMDAKEEFAFAANHVSSGDTLLEVGCGRGAFGQRLTCKEYVGLEFNPKAVQEAVAQGLHVRRQSVEEHAAERPGHYDVACSFQVLEHVTAPRPFLEALHACVKPGGLLLLSVPSEDSYLSMIVNEVLNMPPHHLTLWSDDSLRRLPGLFGMSLVELRHEKLQPYHTRMFCKALLVETLRSVEAKAKRKMLDISPEYMRLEAAAAGLAQHMAGVLDRYPVRPDGHTVIAVYRKN
ncbi:class I SAM-dependent methyltransferase [Desulfocurvibacter africanus]|uniref:Methyltransferase type 12 n=1 Tax=Desulfocurvibacter africanus subsp. africanus str. Walvis Bay TaxID=690850 RepID=F3YWJ1_DESAF|nr:class I SAM-dependent methyltransferase [Desulfocurvibacter africanus]EGJ49377.1 Methyltransferase type 12 [Desulfocurvibacter africanus subsp. africanus str. Walvis Bay]